MKTVEVSESALESLKAMVEQLQSERDELLIALKDAVSVCQSVSISRDRRIVRDGCTLYAQTEEWCKWVEEEVGPKLIAAIAKCTQTQSICDWQEKMNG